MLVPFMSWRRCSVHPGTGAMAPPAMPQTKYSRLRANDRSAQGRWTLRIGCVFGKTVADALAQGVLCRAPHCVCAHSCKQILSANK